MRAPKSSPHLRPVDTLVIVDNRWQYLRSRAYGHSMPEDLVNHLEHYLQQKKNGPSMRAKR